MASYRKLKSGWKVIISKRDSSGQLKQVSKNGFETKNEAKLYAAKIESQENGVFNLKKDTPFSRYFFEWWKTFKEPKLSDISNARYKNISSLLKEYFGDSQISKIDRITYQKFINEYGKSRSKETVYKLNSIIRACVRSAIQDEIITKDFTYNVEVAYKTEKRDIEYLNLDELKRLTTVTLAKLNPNFTSRYMILVGIYTGARIGEISALTWKDINFTDRTISINKSWDYMYKTGFKKTKSNASNRTIRVNKKLLDILEQLKQNNSEMIFENQYKTIPTPTSINKTLKKLLCEAKIDKPSFHFHSLRHSQVAYLLFKGVDLYAISKRLGHSDMTITAKKYAYLIDEYKQRSDNQIESLLDEL